MARTRSPAYPAIPLGDAIGHAQRIFEADHRLTIPRSVAAQHMGYKSLHGGALTALSALGKYGLLEMTAGNVRISELALELLAEPKGSEKRNIALRQSAESPKLFSALRDQFGTDPLPSDEALRAHLLKHGFTSGAVGDVIRSYRETMELVFEAAGEYIPPVDDQEGSDDDPESETFGGAQVGDYIQWESKGTLCLPEPLRVRAIDENGEWVFVDGYEAGIPMSQAIIQERAAAATTPTLPLHVGASDAPNSQPSGHEQLEYKLSDMTRVRLSVTGEMGTREIGRLIRLLETQREILGDEEEKNETIT